MQTSSEAVGLWRRDIALPALCLLIGSGDPPGRGGGGGRVSSPRHRQRSSRRPRSDTPVIYLVCEDASLRASLFWLLTSNGYAVETCAHSDSGLEEESFENACLLLDLRSSPGRGVGLLDRLSRRRLFPPIVLMTGYDEPMAVIRSSPSCSSEAGQPFDIGLLRRIDAALAAGRRAHERERTRADLARRLEHLTIREKRALEAILAAPPELAAVPGERASAPRREQLLKKLRVRSWAHLARLALQLEEGSDE